MSAPERPAEAPVWTSPPPSSPRPFPTWAVVLVLIAVIAGGGFLARLVIDGEPVEEETSPQVADASPMDAEEDPDPEPIDPVLAELRATDRFVAFAEHERAAAAHAEGVVAFGWNNFAVIHEGGRVAHEWTNKAELWDDVVPPIRDELLLLGEPYTEPMWDEEFPETASIGARWPNEATEGRGQYIEINGRYYDQERAVPVERVWAVLVVTHPDGRGEVVTQMPPIELVPSQAVNFRHSRELIRGAAWEWVQSQPPAERESS